MKMLVFLFIALWRSCSWTLRAILKVIRGPIALAGVLFEVLGRIFVYSLGWLL